MRILRRFDIQTQETGAIVERFDSNQEPVHPCLRTMSVAILASVERINFWNDPFVGERSKRKRFRGTKGYYNK